MATIAPSKGKSGGLAAQWKKLPPAAKIGLPVLLVIGAYYIYKKREADASSGTSTADTTPTTTTPTTDSGTVGGGGSGGGNGGQLGQDLSNLTAAIQALQNQSQTTPGTTTPGTTATTVSVPGQGGTTIQVPGNSAAANLYQSNPSAPIFAAGVDPNSPFATGSGAYDAAFNNTSAATGTNAVSAAATPTGSPAAQVLAGVSPSKAGLVSGTSTPKHL